MRHDAGVVEARVERLLLGVVVRPRHRPQGLGRDVLVRCRLVLPDGFQVLLLERVLPRDPVVPGVVERAAEHLLELRRVVGLGVLATARPLDHELGRALVGQVAQEAGAVEVRVDLGLEVHLDALGDEPERVVEARVVPHHRAEHHLVVGALGAALAAGHPGLDEDGESLLVPARRRRPRRRQVEVEDALGLGGHGRDLALEQAAEEALAARGLVRGRHVHELVVHQPVHPLVRHHRLEGEAERGHVHLDEVARHRRRRRVAAVGEVVEQHRDGTGRGVREQLAVEGERVLEAARGVRRRRRSGVGSK